MPPQATVNTRLRAARCDPADLNRRIQKLLRRAFRCIFRLTQLWENPFFSSQSLQKSGHKCPHYRVERTLHLPPILNSSQLHELSRRRACKSCSAHSWLRLAVHRGRCRRTRRYSLLVLLCVNVRMYQARTTSKNIEHTKNMVTRPGLANSHHQDTGVHHSLM